MIFKRVNQKVLSTASKTSRNIGDRRGVLLLVTVCMLTLFLMLGTAYLVAASRARESANAIARKALFADQTNYRPETYLDTVLMRIVRGGTAPQALGTISAGFESLLADKYGTATVEGDITGAKIFSGDTGAGATGPVITLNFDVDSDSGSTVEHPAELNGRILTLVASGHSISHRIIRATGSGSSFKLAITNPRSPHQWTGGANGTINNFSGTAIINGREFSGSAPANEAWDGFDDNNQYLAQVEPGSAVSTTRVVKPTYFDVTDWSDIDNDGTLDTEDTNGNRLLDPGEDTNDNGELDVDFIDCDSDSIADNIDNDGDGVDDGVFLKWGLPSLSTANGTINLHASALIVDLDGRFNVNAHGSLANMPIRINPTDPKVVTVYDKDSSWPVNGQADDRDDIEEKLELVPLGSGVGVSEVNASHMFSTLALNATAASDDSGEPKDHEQIAGLFITGGRKNDTRHGKRADKSRFTKNLHTPMLGALEGRYGNHAADQSSLETNMITQLMGTDDVALPGGRNGSSTGGQVGDTIMSAYGIPTDWWGGTTASFSSPPDLLGRMKFLTRPALVESENADEDRDGRFGTFGLVPRPTYAKAEWAGEHSLSPYNSRLTSIGTRGGKLHAASTNGTTAPTETQPTENPFTLAELESLLRPYDADSSTLPMRLQAMLGTVAEQMRTRLTTESWDTTAIVDGSDGGAWKTIQDAITTTLPLPTDSRLYSSSPVRGALGGEISRGEKFNLNRQLTNTKPPAYDHEDSYYMQRQAYFKDLYTLLVLLNPNATLEKKEEYAQWAANVVEFCDADSTMTPFEYDTDLSNGWECDGNVVLDPNNPEPDRGDTVWGTERPEVLITSGVGWEDSSGQGEIYIGLHRPWKSDALDGGSAPDCRINSGVADADFDAPGTDLVDLVKRPSGADYPIWRFRIESGTSSVEVPFQLPDEAEMSTLGLIEDQRFWNDSKIKLGTDDWLGIRMSTTVTAGELLTFDERLLRNHDNQSGTPDRELELFRATTNYPGTAITFPGLPVAAGVDRTVTVHLERLDCPANDGDANWSLAAEDGYSGATLSNLEDARYLSVDSMRIVLVNRDQYPPSTPKPTFEYVSNQENKRRDSPTNREFWLRASNPNPPLGNEETTTSPITYRNSPAPPPPSGTLSLLGDLTAFSSSNIAAYPWLNRPFNSPVELFLIPDDSPRDLLANYRTLLNPTPPPDPLPLHDVPNLLLLQTVTTPTLFAGVHDSWGDDDSEYLQSETGIDSGITPVNQLSSYREPGRVNLNTITNDQTWDAVVAGPLPVEDVDRDGSLDIDPNGNGGTPDPHPVQERKTIMGGPSGANLDSTPAQTMASVLEVGGSAPVRFDSNSTYYNAVDVELNPQHKIYTASRLANTATVRSNVFAVWVTLRESISDGNQADPDSVKYHRAFYIIDRSIPVGFEAGKDHNVKDTIRLRRIIE